MVKHAGGQPGPPATTHTQQDLAHFDSSHLVQVNIPISSALIKTLIIIFLSLSKLQVVMFGIVIYKIPLLINHKGYNKNETCSGNCF